MNGAFRLGVVAAAMNKLPGGSPGGSPGGGAHAYWRLHITANNGDANYLAIDEIEFRDAPGGADLANGGTAIASGFESGSPPANAFFNTSSTWAVSVAGGNFPQWIGYHFLAPGAPAELSVRGGGIIGARMPSAWTIEYSDDGIAWTSVASITGQTTWAANETRVFPIPT